MRDRKFTEWLKSEETYWLMQRFNLSEAQHGMLLLALYENITKFTAQRIYKDGFTEGYEDGYAVGYADYLKEGKP
jgi:hypothetical protein